MKKMWKKNNKAVSPVIATILMVAITVVLAAVLYVMVMGFGDSGNPEAPTVSLTKTTISTGYSVVITISPATPDTNIAVALDGVVATTGFTLVQADADTISTGDRIVFTSAEATAAGSVQLVYTGGESNQFVGNIIDF